MSDDIKKMIEDMNNMKVGAVDPADAIKASDLLPPVSDAIKQSVAAAAAAKVRPGFMV
jgi:hypothetical protein